MIRGILLAGGKSSRFGGDKALASVSGLSFLEIIAGKIKALGLEPVIVTSHQRDYSFFPYRIEKDLIADQGPMGGLYTACRIFPQDTLLVLTCDMPFVNESVLRVLIDRHKKENRITVYENKEGENQPFPGIYEAFLGGSLSKRIRNAKLSIQDFLDSVLEKQVLPLASDFKVLSNINHAQDLANLIDES